MKAIIASVYIARSTSDIKHALSRADRKLQVP